MSAQNPARDRPAPSAERSIASLLENLSEVERERLAVDVIRQNRRYLEHAQTLFERLRNSDGAIAVHGDAGRNDLRHEYHFALVNLSGHHQVVRAVIDALGYVPDVPDATSSGETAQGLN
ncbi:transcriptional repressor TraM [Oceaniradius stylonematis]|uniref:transcriptional repressor TraM n=1 Tax=Oceaniradius stylonematis TaxID=2184161 RepID=UPI00273D228C|nr:transcriptional repressor TraM [Oceaniradius stylonematis]